MAGPTMQLGALPLMAPIQTTPAPVQVEAGVRGIRTPDGRQVVGLQIATPIGVQFFFLSPEGARQLARQLDEASGGIVLAQTMPAAAG